MDWKEKMYNDCVEAGVPQEVFEQYEKIPELVEKRLRKYFNGLDFAIEFSHFRNGDAAYQMIKINLPDFDRYMVFGINASAEFTVSATIRNTTRVYPDDIILTKAFPDEEKWKLANYPGTMEEKVNGFMDWLHESMQKEAIGWLMLHKWSGDYSIYNSPLL